MRRGMMRSLPLASLLTIIVCVPVLAEDRPPNFVVILADDLGAGELGCYGNAEHRTPNLDRLASEGVKFETAFACTVCHPTRFEIMTGQYGHHNGVHNFAGSRGGPDVGGEGPDNIASHLTFAQVLKPRGYATALAGKWQLSGEPPTLITECGFDEYCTWGYRQYYSREDGRRAEEAGQDFRSRYWGPSIIENGRWRPTTIDDYGPDIFDDFVIDFVQRHKDEPFFVYYPMCLTHGPWVSTPDTTASEADRTVKSQGNFAANVEYMDKQVGRIAAALREAGVADNTVILFTGDNGTGFRGKSEAIELGARVPLIAHGPGIVRKRGSTLELADLSDVMPTLAEMAGADLPANVPIDGHSLARFLTGESEATREWIYAYQADRRVLRTKRWLLEDNSPLHYGRLFDCGGNRDGVGYRDVTDSMDAETLAAKKYFDELIAKLPVPYIATEGKPNDPKLPKDKREESGKKRRRSADKND